MPLAVVVLAAGQGTRMKSDLPKVLHEAAGRPLVEHVLRAVYPLGPERVVVVTGYKAEEVEAKLAGESVQFARQTQQLGTGHALLQTKEVLEDFDGAVMVLNGDGPLLKTETLKRLAQTQGDSGAGMTLVTCEVNDPTGLGRIIRKADGSVAKIVEEKDATEEERHVREINPGIYIFNRDVFSVAAGLSNDNAAGEYYITDLVDLYLRAGHAVQAVKIEDETEILAVNDREQLAAVERILQARTS